MDVRCLIVLPRLHHELATAPAGLSLPPEAQFLWPGLPQKPDAYFQPEGAYPWSPEQAAACVRDFESIARDGAKGRPVQALAQNDVLGGELLGMKHDISLDERLALQQWRQAEASPPARHDAAPVTDQERQTAAQRVLLLAWLRESQNLELQALEAKVQAGHGLLKNILGDGMKEGLDAFGESTSESPAQSSAVSSTTDNALPAWRDVLEAAACFLPQDAQIVVTDRGMADTILAQATGTSLHATDGWTVVQSRVGLRAGTFIIPTVWHANEREKA